MTTRAGGHLLRETQDLAGDHLGIVDVAGEGLLVADALLRGVGHDVAVIATPGQVVQALAGRLAECAHERVDRGVRDIAHRAQAEGNQALLGALPHAP